MLALTSILQSWSYQLDALLELYDTQERLADQLTASTRVAEHAQNAKQSNHLRNDQLATRAQQLSVLTILLELAGAERLIEARALATDVRVGITTIYETYEAYRRAALSVDALDRLGKRTEQHGEALRQARDEFLAAVLLTSERMQAVGPTSLFPEDGAV